jgi:hypothetical protein
MVIAVKRLYIKSHRSVWNRLGLRQVEKKLGRLSLEKGIESETNFLSASPVDCGLDADEVKAGVTQKRTAALWEKAGGKSCFMKYFNKENMNL